MMEKLGRAWTDGIAYIALLVSAGLSLAGNVVDTYRIRGLDTDTLDIWLAVTWPGLVVLMVHVFVSSRWIGLGWAMQVLRWLGCLSIGAVAMRASWIHLNDLLASRGQPADVATLGPLAIDFLAIMSTALILAGRRRGHAPKLLANPADVATGDMAKLATDWDKATANGHRTLYVPDGAAVATAEDVATSEDIFKNPAKYMATADDGHLATAGDVPDTIPSWLDGLTERVQQTPRNAPVSPAGPSNRVRPEAIPAEAAEWLTAWWSTSVDVRPGSLAVDLLISEATGKSTRTVRRWREALKPVS